MKACPDCPPGQEWHHEEAFYRRANSKDGFDVYCKEHRRQRTREWREKNAEQVKYQNKRRTLERHAERVAHGEVLPNKTEYRGVKEVTYDRLDGPVTVYYARITVQGQRYTIQHQPGIFQFYTPEDAARAYDQEVEKLGLNRVLNRELYPQLG